jgi:hypothetical protein
MSDDGNAFDFSGLTHAKMRELRRALRLMAYAEACSTDLPRSPARGQYRVSFDSLEAHMREHGISFDDETDA